MRIPYVALVIGIMLGTVVRAGVVTTTTMNGDWDDNPTNTNPTAIWDNGFPTNSDTAVINHEVYVDRQNGAFSDPSYVGYDTTPADVVVSSNGALKAWFGIFNCPTLTLNGGQIAANQRTHVLTVNALTVNEAGGVWTQYKNQNSKHARIRAGQLLGSGLLDIRIGHGGQLFELNVDDTTGFDGVLNVSRLGVGLPANAFEYRLNRPTGAATNYAHLKINQSVTKEDASFDLVLNSYTFDYVGTDDGTCYNGYDIRDGNVEVWVNSLTIGGFEVPGRDTAYTYSELAVMNGGDVDNFLRSDGTDGTLGVVLSELPGTALFVR